MNIVITGASRGIGYSTVKVFAKNKNNKITVLTRNVQSFLEKINADPELKEGNLTVHYLDLQNFSAENFPKIEHNVDILINNSGLLIKKPFSSLEENDWWDTFQTNVFGPMKLIKYLLPLLGQNNTPSHIVNIGSMGGFQGSSKFAGLAAYSASKGALSILSECLAEELKDRSIISNCLCLGAVDTNMLQESFPGYKAPLTSDEMGVFVADFALHGCKYFNGKTLPVSLSTP